MTADRLTVTNERQENKNNGESGDHSNHQKFKNSHQRIRIDNLRQNKTIIELSLDLYYTYRNLTAFGFQSLISVLG